MPEPQINAAPMGVQSGTKQSHEPRGMGSVGENKSVCCERASPRKAYASSLAAGVLSSANGGEELATRGVILNNLLGQTGQSQV